MPSLGYLASPRNRSKVRAWFRKLDEEQNRQQGKQILERELQRLAIHSVTLPELIGEFNFDDAEQLYLAIGEGEINVAQISGAIQRRAKPQELPSPVPRRPAASAEGDVGHHDRRRRRSAVELRALLRPGAAGSASPATSRWGAASASIATTARASAGCRPRIPSA